MVIMGVDQSFTSTGVYVQQGNERVFDSVIVTVPDKEDAMAIFKRARVVADQILEIITDQGVGKVMIEGIPMGNIKGNSSRYLAGLQFIIIDTIINKYPEILLEIITPTSLKKFATGKGNAPKTAMLESMPTEAREYVESRYLKTKGRYDMADAYWLCQRGFYTEDEAEMFAPTARL